jgi:hypothetical protein
MRIGTDPCAQFCLLEGVAPATLLGRRAHRLRPKRQGTAALQELLGRRAHRLRPKRQGTAALQELWAIAPIDSDQSGRGLPPSRNFWAIAPIDSDQSGRGLPPSRNFWVGAPIDSDKSGRGLPPSRNFWAIAPIDSNRSVESGYTPLGGRCSCNAERELKRDALSIPLGNARGLAPYQHATSACSGFTAEAYKKAIAAFDKPAP